MYLRLTYKMGGGGVGWRGGGAEEGWWLDWMGRVCLVKVGQSRKRAQQEDCFPGVKLLQHQRLIPPSCGTSGPIGSFKCNQPRDGLTNPTDGHFPPGDKVTFFH